MAEVLGDGFKFRRGMRPIYPWDEWTDGQTWRIRKGVDFKVAMKAMRHAIYYTACARKLIAHTHQEGEGTLVFRFDKATAGVKQKGNR